MEDTWMVCPECGEQVNGSNVESVIKNEQNKKQKKSILKRWWFWVIIVVLSSTILFSGEDTSEINDNTSETQTESKETSDEKSGNTEVADKSETDVVEKYKWIAKNDDPSFEIPEKSIEFMNEHPNFFPGSENIQGAISDFVDEQITFAHLTKNISKYGDGLVSVYGVVIDIEESEDGDVTYMHILDYDGNSYVLYYLGTLEDVFEESEVYVYALPFALTTFENMDATYTEAVTGAACFVGEPYS